MIDDKKIEEASKRYSEEAYISDYFQACYKDAFIESAKWAINEFLKDLWHPIEEKPEKEKAFLYQSSCYGFGLNQISDTKDWDFIIKYQKAIQWLYIDDLISKI